MNEIESYGRSHEVIHYWTTRGTETYDHMGHVQILETLIIDIGPYAK